MIVFIVFLLIILSDVLEIVRVIRFRKSIDRQLFLQSVLIVGGAIFLISILSTVFHLQKKYMFYLFGWVITSVLLLIRYTLIQIKEKHAFEDVSQYMLRICVYYRSHQKISPTLIDAKIGFEGVFEKKCQKAIEIFESGKGLKKAMSEISSHYLLKSLVEILESSENIGHSYSGAQLSRLEYDIEQWIFQTKSFQKEEMKLRNRMLILFGIGLLISYFAQNMMMQSINMKDSMAYQKLMFTFLAANITALVYLSQRLCQSWFLSQEAL